VEIFIYRQENVGNTGRARSSFVDEDQPEKGGRQARSGKKR
jgi:hypothetical protein